MKKLRFNAYHKQKPARYDKGIKSTISDRVDTAQGNSQVLGSLMLKHDYLSKKLLDFVQSYNQELAQFRKETKYAFNSPRLHP